MKEPVAELPTRDGDRAASSRTAAKPHLAHVTIQNKLQSWRGQKQGCHGRVPQPRELQAWRAELQAGRLCSPLSSSPICHPSHLDSGVPGLFAGGCGRVAGACAAAAREDSSSTCSWLCVPSALWPVTQIPAPAQGSVPPVSLGKAGERSLGLRGEAEAGRPCVPSLLLQQMAAQGGGGHPEIMFGVFLGCCKSLCIGWSLSREQGEKGEQPPKAWGSL